MKTVGRLIGLAGALLLSVTSLAPASAAGAVTQVITCGGSGNSLAACIVDLTLTAVNFSTTAQESQGTITLTAGELGCGGQGWNVTVQSSIWARHNGGPSISANAFRLMPVANPAAVSGQGFTTLGGPKLMNNVGTLNQSRKDVQTNAGYGRGSYSQVLGVKLTISGTALPGTYSSVVTTTISTGP